MSIKILVSILNFYCSTIINPINMIIQHVLMLGFGFIIKIQLTFFI